MPLKSWAWYERIVAVGCSLARRADSKMGVHLAVYRARVGSFDLCCLQFCSKAREFRRKKRANPSMHASFTLTREFMFQLQSLSR